MCFAIQHDQPRPTQTTVYKVVYRCKFAAQQVMEGIYYPGEYRLGVPTAIPLNSKTMLPREEGSDTDFSAAGLYVFLRKTDALRELDDWGSGYSVIECTVDPIDFIHRGMDADRPVATYYKLTPVKIL